MIITGLGNPGQQYDKTRHNFGFWAIDVIAAKLHVSLNIKQHSSIIGHLSFHGERHFLLKPQTYMNLSGEAASSIMLDEEIPPEELLVIVDDINLPIGRIRLRSSGSDGGHNGLKSIINHVGKKFWRLRVGVGLPIMDKESEVQTNHEDLVSHVLGDLNNTEQKILDLVLSDIPDIVALWLLGMGNNAMTKYNGKIYETETSE